ISDFAGSGPEDLHFTLDRVAGEIVLGPAVRRLEGALHQYGAIPPKGTQLRVREYRTGGGRQGNVGRGALNVLKSSIPYLAGVENRYPATGGVDVEDIENA